MYLKWGTIGDREKGMGRTRGGGQYTSNLGPECYCVYVVLIENCVKVISMRDARYVHLISWTLQSGSEQ
jgi:hypothetical protein